VNAPSDSTMLLPVPRSADPHATTHSATVYKALRNRLVTGTIEPGTRLVELDLAADLGVSRTPVREALRRLESDGFVQRIPGTGIVASPMGPDDVGDIGLLRVEIEGVAAQLAVARATARDWARLRSLADAFLDVADDDEDGLNAAHLALHRAIYEIAFSPRLHGFLENYLLPYLELSFNVGTTSPQHSHRQHMTLLKALSSGDVDRAVKASRDHASSGARTAQSTFNAATKPSRGRKT
jgi:DNA-binding GntR family transcriptional regulator